MAREDPKAQPVLPISVVTNSDITRLRHELEKLSDFLIQESLRKSGQPISLPRVTKRLDELGRLHGLTLTKTEDCRKLTSYLEEVNRSAPRIHMSFAVDPSDEFLSKIITWFRSNIDPRIILTIGLQPGIAAGFIMRTSSHYYDCSLRKHFDDKKYLLAEALNSQPIETTAT